MTGVLSSRGLSLNPSVFTSFTGFIAEAYNSYLSARFASVISINNRQNCSDISLGICWNASGGFLPKLKNSIINFITTYAFALRYYTIFLFQLFVSKPWLFWTIQFLHAFLCFLYYVQTRPDIRFSWYQKPCI